MNRSESHPLSLAMTTMQPPSPQNTKYASAPHLDPVLKQSVKALDALSDRDLDELGFDPIDEERDSHGRPTHLQCVIPCTEPPVHRTSISFDWPLHLHIVGQLNPSAAPLPTMQDVDGQHMLPVTTVGLWIESRQDLTSRIQWEQMADKLEKLVYHFPLVEELDTSALFDFDERGSLRVLVHFDVEVRAVILFYSLMLISSLQAQDGFPIWDADGDRIALPDVSQVPVGVAVRVVFRLECNKKPGDGGRFMLHAPITYASFV